MPRRKLINLLRRSYRAVRKPSELAQILQSELKYEQTTVPHYLSKEKLGSLGNFTLDWDDPKSQDVVLRRKYDMGEEIAVSAMLGPPIFEDVVEGLFPRTALMKVCIKKPGLSSVLHFDCDISGKSEGGSVLFIHNASFLPSSSSFGDSVYRAPLLRLDLKFFFLIP
ncbi:hypothetical protein BVC80_1549g6 [Macleaya cordata]|uniref:Mitochondrial glycoprotein n=1 Tax=Macleaya cordata TaxID=56857 RepID=A0A200R1E2_MACCD|nr:hypothetical protein BVC80_1549g6 [Macleaya cordata]